jgi:hypothetical protein
MRANCTRLTQGDSGSIVTRSHAISAFASCASYTVIEVALIHVNGPRNRSVTLLRFIYLGADWMFIAKGQPLLVLAGDSARAFEGGHPRRDVLDDGDFVGEQANYAVTSENLAWLVSLPDDCVRVTGEKGNCDFPLKAEVLVLAGMFNDRVVRDSASTASH